MLEFIIKRDGRREPFDASKLNKWSLWAARNIITRVDWAHVVMKTVKSLGKEVESKVLNQELIRNLVRAKRWPEQLMAGGLYASDTRKEIFGGALPTVRKLHQQLVGLNLMEKMKYSDEDYMHVERMIDHTRDFNMALFQAKQMRKKYSIRNEVKNIEYETPQFTFMRMAMALAENSKPEERLGRIESLYNSFSMFRVNAPTPNYINLGTQLKGFASCCLYAVDDNIESLAAGDHIAYKMTAISAGIGNILMTRSLGDPIRGGKITHQGKLPYFRSQAGAVTANKQAGRAGADTTYVSIFDPEIETITMLQNPRSPVDKRNRDIHFALLHNKLVAKMMARNEDMFLFNIKTAPDLYEAQFSGDSNAFEALYRQYERDPDFIKTYVSARETIVRFRQQRNEVSTLYGFQIDEANRHTPHKDPIRSANLCVAPETQILTDKGYFEIAPLVNQQVNVWNGEEFSEVTVRQTSEMSELVTVTTDSGYSMDCTPYHRFYVQFGNETEGDVVEMMASELKPGHALIKFNLPVIEGEKTLDGALINSQDFQEKYFIPDASYSIKSRLAWLSHLTDVDGSVYFDGNDQQLTISSYNEKFIKDVALMIQTLGVIVKVTLQNSDKNDTSVESKPHYKLLISGVGLESLCDMGLAFQHLTVSEHSLEQTVNFPIRITSVVDHGRCSPTYCFTEPERHMGMFNGMLTGQCIEVAQPTQTYLNTQQLYVEGDLSRITFKTPIFDKWELKGESMYETQRGLIRGCYLREGDTITDENGVKMTAQKFLGYYRNPEVSTCSLGGIVVSHTDDDALYGQACYDAAVMIDECIHKSDFPLPHVRWTALQRLNAGIGILGLAHHMARKNLKWNTPEGLIEIDKVMERHSYFCIKAALRLGQERGNAPWMHRTKWPEGWLPIDTYKKTVDELVPFELRYPWEELRSAIIANGGIRFSTVVQLMPTESSSKASGAPNGPYQIRDLDLKKTDSSNLLDWCAPDNDILADQYQLAWETSTIEQVKYYSVMQKWTDGSISADIYRDRTHFTVDENGMKVINPITDEELIEEHLAVVRYGLKGEYYMNSFTGGKIIVDEETKEPLVEVIEVLESGCEGACTL